MDGNNQLGLCYNLRLEKKNNCYYIIKFSFKLKVYNENYNIYTEQIN